MFFGGRTLEVVRWGELSGDTSDVGDRGMKTNHICNDGNVPETLELNSRDDFWLLGDITGEAFWFTDVCMLKQITIVLKQLLSPPRKL